MLGDKDWVVLVRQTLSSFGVTKPEDLIPDGDDARAIAIDLRVNLYMAGSIVTITPEITSAWFKTNKIERTYALEEDVTRIANEVYFEDKFRESVFRTLYNQDLERKRRNPER